MEATPKGEDNLAWLLKALGKGVGRLEARVARLEERVQVQEDIRAREVVPCWVHEKTRGVGGGKGVGSHSGEEG